MWKEWTMVSRLNKSQIKFSSFFHFFDLDTKGSIFLKNRLQEGLKLYIY